MLRLFFYTFYYSSYPVFFATIKYYFKINTGHKKETMKIAPFTYYYLSEVLLYCNLSFTMPATKRLLVIFAVFHIQIEIPCHFNIICFSFF